MTKTGAEWPLLKPAVLAALPPGTPVTIDDGYTDAKTWTDVRLPKRRQFNVFYYRRADYDPAYERLSDPASYHAVPHVSVHFNDGDDTYRAWVPVMTIVEIRDVMRATLAAAGPSVLGGAVETEQFEGGESTEHVLHGTEDRHGRPTLTTFSYLPNCEYWDDWSREDPNTRWKVQWIVDSQIWYWNIERVCWCYDVSEYTGYGMEDEDW